MRLTRSGGSSDCTTGGGCRGRGGSSSSKSSATASGTAQPSVSFGSIDFTGSEGLAYINSVALKAAGIPWRPKPNLGSREAVQPALQSGAFDAAIELVGSYLLPQVLGILNQVSGVSGVLTTVDLIQFNLDVGVNQDDPTSDAFQFVPSHRLG
jgi:glycine betaine/choline ABC-type transport system substrate-binding protein